MPLFLAPAFSNFALRLSNQMGVVNACQCMSMHIMHIAVSSASEKSSWQLVSCHTGCTICSASSAGAHHRDSGISTHFEHVSVCRPTLCPLGRNKSTTIACTCLSRTINSAKWTNSSTLQRILTGSSKVYILDIFLIHYSKEIFGRGHEAYECLENL